MAANFSPRISPCHRSDILYAPVTCNSGPDLKNAAYAEIKREISRLQAERATLYASMHALYTRHNALSNVARLPSELLLEVFKVLAEEDREYNRIHGKSNGPRWIRITHVCSSWRQIALECPTLWTHISFNDECYLKCFKEFIFRSKALPLHIQASKIGRDGNEMPLEIGDALHGIMHRVQDLSVRLANSEDVDAPLLCRPWPQAILLKKLVVYGFSDREEDQFWYNPHRDYSSLGETFLNGRTRQLRWLTLRNYNLPLNYLLPISLTRFHVHHLPYPIPVGEMINVLQTIPNLQYLVLEEWCDYSDQSSLHNVDLPRLRQLQIIDNPDICIALFTHLTIPPTTFRIIDLLDLYVIDVNSISDIIGNLGKQLARNMEPIRCVRIEYTQNPENDIDIRFEAWGCAGPCQDPPFDVPLIAITLCELPPYSTELIFRLWDMLPTQQLESMYATNMHSSHAATWRRAFGHLPVLRTIQFNSFYQNEFIRALNEPSTAAELEPGQSEVAPLGLLFGALRKLVAVGWDLRERTDSDGKPSALDLLVDCMGERQRRGVVLDELRIVDPPQFSASTLERLRGVIRLVDLDGI